jgi:hypothetical protein
MQRPGNAPVPGPGPDAARAATSEPLGTRRTSRSTARDAGASAHCGGGMCRIRSTPASEPCELICVNGSVES